MTFQCEEVFSCDDAWLRNAGSQTGNTVWKRVIGFVLKKVLSKV